MDKRLKNLKHFKKGVSGNPNGRPKLPPELNKAKQLNKVKVAELLNKFMNMPYKDLLHVLKDKELPNIDRLIASLIEEGINKAQPGVLNFIFDRMIGKVSEEVKLKLPKPTVVQLQSGDSLVMGAEESEDDE